MGAAFLRLKLKDQAKALEMLTSDAQLADLRQLRAPLVDLEVRGAASAAVLWRNGVAKYHW